MTEWILWASGIIAAIAVIWRAIVWFWKITRRIEIMATHVEETYLDCKKLTIMSSDMPMGERMVAAEKYLSAGGNGDVKKFCIDHLGINRVEGEDKP